MFYFCINKLSTKSIIKLAFIKKSNPNKPFTFSSGSISPKSNFIFSRVISPQATLLTNFLTEY